MTYVNGKCGQHNIMKVQEMENVFFSHGYGGIFI